MSSHTGPGRVLIRIQQGDFDLSSEVAALRAGDTGVGAVCAFVGTVRERHEAQAGQAGAAGQEGRSGALVTALELEHYPGMTEKAIREMVEAARARFGIRSATVIHRVGPLALQDQIVLVAVSAAHRGEAFQGCEYLMDFLKTRAPFWKKEWHADGSVAWVDARESDTAAADRWQEPQPPNMPPGAGLPGR